MDGVPDGQRGEMGAVIRPHPCTFPDTIATTKRCDCAHAAAHPMLPDAPGERYDARTEPWGLSRTGCSQLACSYVARGFRDRKDRALPGIRS